MQRLGRKSAMNNGKFGTWTSECLVVLITEWEMISPWSPILWLTLNICFSTLVCLAQRRRENISNKFISDRIFSPLMEAVRTATEITFIDWSIPMVENLSLCLRLSCQLQGLATLQVLQIRSLCNQGWLVLACILYRYGILVLAADSCLCLWSLKTCLLWLSTAFLLGVLTCCWVRSLWLVLLPSVPGPFLWWNSGVPGTHKHNNLTASRTQSGLLIPTVCLSITCVSWI